MIGHLNGLNVIEDTTYHIKVLLSRVSPAVPVLLAPTAQRLSRAMRRQFPDKINSWTTIKPLDIVVGCISEGFSFVLLGEPMCDNPDVARLMVDHTKNSMKSRSPFN